MFCKNHYIYCLSQMSSKVHINFKSSFAPVPQNIFLCLLHFLGSKCILLFLCTFSVIFVATVLAFVSFTFFRAVFHFLPAFEKHSLPKLFPSLFLSENNLTEAHYWLVSVIKHRLIFLHDGGLHVPLV